MPASIGVNLRVTGNCRQGGRKYMEDCFSVAYQQTEDEKDLEYAFFGIYDGHGGVEAASFAKEHLMETIIKHKNFWSDDDEDVLRAIRDGYIATHYAMWREQSKWPRTSSGLPSTAGTTASVAFIRRGKIYIGHVGDSGIILGKDLNDSTHILTLKLGYQEPGSSDWKARPLTKDHKPENPDEIRRIHRCGGKVIAKSGVPRVVWNRPKVGHQGPVRRSTPIDEIPFLAVARSLGDLWSYNSQMNQFVVSPYPDCSVITIDTSIHRCLIFGTDGLYNMLTPAVAVSIVQQAERHNECEALSDDYNKVWLNPSKLLVERALNRWYATKMRADNTSAVTLMLDPPGPPRAQVLKDRKKNLPERGLKIMTRFDESAQESNNPTLVEKHPSTPEPIPVEQAESQPVEEKPLSEENETSASMSSHNVSSNYPLKERNFAAKPPESTSFDPREPYRISDVDKENTTINQSRDNSIQINEISSSNIELDKSLDENTQQKRPTKRKASESLQNNQQRKSLRISQSAQKPAPCTLAEERLKKLAAEAEKSKEIETNNNVIRKLSVTQKIMKCKKANSKKKSQFNKKNIKVVFEAMMTRNRNKVAPKGDSPAKSDDCRVPILDHYQKGQENVSSRPNRKVPKKLTIAGKLSALKRKSLRNPTRRKQDYFTKKTRTRQNEKSANEVGKENTTTKTVNQHKKSKLPVLTSTLEKGLRRKAAVKAGSKSVKLTRANTKSKEESAIEPRLLRAATSRRSATRKS